MTVSVAYVDAMSLSIASVSVFLKKHPLLLQLARLYLGDNLLEGTLPASWSECRSVSLYLDTVSDQCKPQNCPVRC